MTGCLKMNSTELMGKISLLEDYDEAIGALRILKSQNSELAKRIAIEILNVKKGDEYFQASAFELLYSIDRREAIDFFEANFSCLSQQVFYSIVESVTEDSSIADEHLELMKACELIKKKILTLDSEGLAELSDVIDWFKKSFAR